MNKITQLVSSIKNYFFHKPEPRFPIEIEEVEVIEDGKPGRRRLTRKQRTEQTAKRAYDRISVRIMVTPQSEERLKEVSQHITVSNRREESTYRHIFNDHLGRQIAARGTEVDLTGYKRWVDYVISGSPFRSLDKEDSWRFAPLIQTKPRAN